MSIGFGIGILVQLAYLGADEHWVWHRNFGSVGMEAGEGDRVE